MTKATKFSTERSAARQALAAAISDAATAAQSAESARAALSRASKLVSQAHDDLDAAKEKNTAAKEARTAQIVSAATSGEGLTQDTASRAARRQEADAAEELAAAEAALEAVRESLNEPDADLRRAQDRVTKCINAVITGESARLMDEARQLAKPLAEKIVLMRQLVSRDSSYPQEMRELNSFVGRFLLPDYIFNQATAERDTWLAAIEVLKTDADARFPE